MLKEKIVHTALGGLALDLRDRWQLLRATASLESVGTAANDSLARRLVERLCVDGGGFIDVGAHIGSVISGVRRHSRPGRIIAIEAIEAKVAALKRRFPDVQIEHCAAGDQAGEVRFFVDHLRSGFSSLDASLKERASGIAEIVVPMKRLDDIVGNAAIDLIKIDVEGAELGVLRGAERIVGTSRPTIMFESGEEAMEGMPKADLWAWLEAQDYDVLVPNRLAHLGDGLTETGFLEAHLYPRRTTNYFAVARDRRMAVRDRARSVLGMK